MKTRGGEGKKERLPLGKFSPLMREEGEKRRGRNSIRGGRREGEARMRA